MLIPLRRLLDAVHEADASAQIIFAGDYVNRGPDSCKVIELLLTLQNTRFIRGNHDDIFDLVLHGSSYAENAAGTSPAVAFQWFMDYGLDRTFYSYGADWNWLNATARNPTKERMAQLQHFVPPAHRTFIRNLPAFVDEKEFFVVHGRFPALEKLAPPSLSYVIDHGAGMRQTLLWGRYPIEEIEAEKLWTKRGFVGHTPIHSYYPDPRSAPMVPINGPQLTLVDTACALVTWGRLTAFCVEEDRFLQTTHFGEFVRTI